jgi:hypothetical protein
LVHVAERSPAFRHIGIAAEVGFVGKYVAATLAHRRRVVIPHRFTDTVRHEPGGAVGAEAEIAADLHGGDAPLARHHKVRREQPFVQRNVRPLVSRAHRGGEGLTAVFALVEAGARAFALEQHGIVDGAAMEAGPTVGPADALKMGAGCVFVVEDFVVAFGMSSE